MPVATIPLHLPRHAVSPRQVARPAELWRLCQDAAVLACIEAGWTPERLIAQGSAFMVYAMTVRHIREIPYGRPVRARTWVRDFRRGILTRREVRIEDASGPVAEATQEWVHVNLEGKPARASAALLASFPPHDAGEPAVSMPAFEACDGGHTHEFAFEVWHSWMDPLAHVNHPVYVDWAEEAICRALAAAGLDPQGLVPVAETVSWRRGCVAPMRARVRSRLGGRTAGGAVAILHEIVSDDAEAELFATATTVRHLAGGDDDAPAAALG